MARSGGESKMLAAKVSIAADVAKMETVDQEFEIKRRLGIEDERFDEIREIFAMFDEKRTGKIECNNLGYVLRGLGFNITEAELDDVINMHDKNGDGLISLPDFIDILANHEFRGPELLEKDVIGHFAVFDRKKDGFIDEMDFIEILTKMEEVFTKEDVDMLWREIKVDGDRRINYVDFVHHMLESSRPSIGLSPWIDEEV